MLPPTATRVVQNTRPEINESIMEQTEANVARFGAAPHSIDARLAQLDREWDTERFFEANASGLALTGVILALIHSWYWLIIPLLVTGFLLLHALQGWCPPLPLIRRLGFRTQREIDMERYALKVMRGDFEGLCSKAGDYRPQAREAFAATQR